MPAIDQCEPQVIEALRKAGWVVTHQPFPIRIDRSTASYVYADLRLTNLGDQRSIIVAEVKCFRRTLLDELYEAIGQYAVYRNALALNGIRAPIYLAVPSLVYETFFQKPLVQSTLQDIQVKMVVIDLEQQEIAAWYH